ncbi:MAG: hypothetical protein E6J78_01260 [Deltaproteobacteria bacterium]|nr:MAG: hypothetical protein E6J78_01260 [Deltaproteobacteria bacterium]
MNNTAKWMRILESLCTAAALGCSGEAKAPSGFENSGAQLRSGSSQKPTTTPQTSGTTNRLQAVSPVDENVVWASGVGGTYAVTTDGGNHWAAHVVPGAETLQFRDVQGVSAKVAYLLAAGPGTDSRIYKTEDGGASWKLQFQAPDDPNYFYDCFAFWTPNRGITMADGINSTGHFPAIRTTDGKKWKPIDLPPAQKDEGAFAASGTCVATQGERRAWIVTTNSRVLVTEDGGNRWAAYSAPIAGGTGTAGLFTVAFRDAQRGVVGGGDFLGATVLDNFARSKDGGKTWRLTAKAPIPGAIFGLAYAMDNDEDRGEDSAPKNVVVTGPNGAAWTPDEGDTWNSLAGLTGFWAVAFADEHSGWLVGTQGRIVKITF